MMSLLYGLVESGGVVLEEVADGRFLCSMRVSS